MKPCRALFLGLTIVLAGCAHQPPKAEVRVEQTNEVRAVSLKAAHEAFVQQEYERASEQYAIAIQHGVDTPLVHFRYGYSLHVTGHPQEALPHHVAATRITNPALRIDALYNAACANALLGHRDEALKYLSHAINAGFKDVAQLKMDSDLDSLRSDTHFKKMLASISGVQRSPSRRPVPA